MPQVRVRDKHQITLPANVVRAANIGFNDVLDVSYKDGVITLATERVMKAKKPSLMALAGSTKGLYGKTTAEREQYTANERASWER
jgi:bifunctional DNA-binding transcriptional regulator/antitoxin component of YhaV-PrlF toxin-antitoxin module